MKRLIGKVVVAGLVASGAVVALGGPSSALPDDPCLDEANYLRQESLFTTAEANALDTYLAWQSADYYVNPLSGEEMWAADTPGGTVEVHSLASYNTHLVDSDIAYIREQVAHASFELNVEICP